MKQSSISFLITHEEFKLLSNVVYLEPYLDEILSKARIEAGGLRLNFAYEDLDDAISALGHHAEYEDYPGRPEQLRSLAEKLEGYRQLRQHVEVHGKFKKK